MRSANHMTPDVRAAASASRMKTLHKQLLLVSLPLLIVLSVAFLYWGRRQQEYVSEQFLMDTLVSIKVYGSDPKQLRSAVAAAYEEMHRIADLADRFPQPGTPSCRISDICRINEGAGKEAVKVAADTLTMLALAKKYQALSHGSFDISIGPVMDLWSFTHDPPQVPSQREIEKSLTLVDSSKVVIDPLKMTVFLPETGMKLDLGALAKGYATEKALQILKNHGIEKALIDAGGNIRVLGTNPRGLPWRIGIKDPRRTEAMVSILSVEDEAVVTSGDYYRFFEVNGNRYHHILDPNTGYPATANMSATVICKDAGLADVLSTAFFVLRGEEALPLAERIGVDLFLVSREGKIYHTPALTPRIQVTSGDTYHYDQGR